MAIIDIQKIRKTYGKFVALDDITLAIESGTIWGLIGPNGSGKTTLLSILTGLMKPDNGRFYINGRVGAIIEKPCFYEHLTGEENLSIIAKGCHEDFDIVKNVLNIVHLEEHKNKIYENYSLGMKQRLGIAASIITSPDILLLDEPTNGLDPIGILEIRGLINDLSKRGCTLILASHLLAEVDQVCSHIALLKEGKLLFEGSREKFLGDNLIENAFLKIIN